MVKMVEILELEDCVHFIKRIKDKSVDLAILDPPYNVKAAEWDKVENYLEWMKSVLTETRRVLKDNGSLYLWGMTSNNDFLRLKLWLDDTVNLEFKNWIVWIHEVKLHRRLKDRFLRKHEDLLFYAGKGNTFNLLRDPPPAFQLKMHKGRYDENHFVPREKLPPSQQKIFKNGLQMGSPAKSWWLGPSNQSNAKKYKKFAGYKSEWVCERIVSVSSNEGDSILVPFAGTGTECLAVKKLKRNLLACEVNEEHYKLATGRIKYEPNIGCDLFL